MDAEQKIKKQELLTLDEAHRAMQEFRKGYENAGGIPPSAIEEDVFLLSHNMLFLANADKPLPEPDATRLRDLLTISIADLKKRFDE